MGKIRNIKNIKKNKVLSAGLAYTIGNYMIKGITFLSLPLFSRLLTTSDYGIVNTYLAYESLLVLFMGMAIHSSVKSAFYEFKDDFEKYISTILLIPKVMLIFGLIAGNIISLFVDLDMNGLTINLLIIHSFSEAIVIIYNNKLSLNYEYKSYLIIAGINTCGSLGLAILLITTILSEKRYLGKILGSVIPFFIIAMCIIMVSRRKVTKEERKRYLSFGIKYSLPTLPHGLSQILLAQLDRVMIKYIYGNSEAGIYSFAYNINQIVLVLITSVDTVWGPWIFKKLDEEDYKTIKKNSTWYIYGMFIVITSIIFISPEIIRIMAVKSYWEGRYVLVPILASTFFCFLYTIPVQVQYYLKKTKSIACVTVLSGLLNVVLNAIFIPRCGYIAAAYTTLVSYGIYFIMHYIASKRNLGKCVFNTKMILMISICFFICGTVAFCFVDKILMRYICLLIFWIVNGMIVMKKREELQVLLKKK